MSGSHEKLPWLFWAQLVLVAIVATLYFTLGGSSGGHGEDAAHEATEASKQTLKPIGEVAVSSEAAASAGSERSGKEIVEKTCQSCHAHGVANAPKLDDSAKADWEARLASGMDSVIETAKKGKGAMPPMGADPSLSDAELKNAIVHMLEKAGVDTSSYQGSSKDSSADSAKATESIVEQAAEKMVDVAEKATASVATAAAAATAAVVATTPSTTTSAVADSVAVDKSADDATAPVAPAAPVAPEPPAATVEEVANTTTTETEETVPAAAAPTETVAIDGAKLYSTTCFACHDTGAAGAPKTGDAAAWKDRIALGKDVLYE
ncbi:MAG: c-type cytochrome, partial [Thiotrichaceae bacterium]